jgi:hypothetical protein
MSAQIFGYFQIALYVALQFWYPIFAVTSGLSSMLGTPVPEASVNKYNETLFQENKVGIPADTIVTPPPSYFVRPKNGRES